MSATAQLFKRLLTKAVAVKSPRWENGKTLVKLLQHCLCCSVVLSDFDTVSGLLQTRGLLAEENVSCVQSNHLLAPAEGKQIQFIMEFHQQRPSKPLIGQILLSPQEIISSWFYLACCMDCQLSCLKFCCWIWEIAKVSCHSFTSHEWTHVCLMQLSVVLTETKW